MGLAEFVKKQTDGSPMPRQGNWGNPNKKQARKIAYRQKVYDDLNMVPPKKRINFPSVHETHRPGSGNARKGIGPGKKKSS